MFINECSSLLHSNPVKGRTGGLQGTPYFENWFLARRTETPVIKSDFPNENVGTGNNYFYYRDQVCSLGICVCVLNAHHT